MPDDDAAYLTWIKTRYDIFLKLQILLHLVDLRDLKRFSFGQMSLAYDFTWPMNTLSFKFFKDIF